ncbi:MAG: hypothetical protein HOO67_00065 [Candidatus Peribacteraceae bacterium]|nr:hypothetical protein [Candidatus Peribacteraceae bacterium]
MIFAAAYTFSAALGTIGGIVMAGQGQHSSGKLEFSGYLTILVGLAGVPALYWGFGLKALGL